MRQSSLLLFIFSFGLGGSLGIANAGEGRRLVDITGFLIEWPHVTDDPWSGGKRYLHALNLPAAPVLLVVNSSALAFERPRLGSRLAAALDNLSHDEVLRDYGLLKNIQ